MLHLFANAGTPLIWFGLVYPFIGSYVVAQVEVRMLRRTGLIRVPVGRWNPILLGNLLTTLLGVAFVANSTRVAERFLGPHPVERASAYVMAVWLTAFLATVFLETPFVAKAIGRPWRSTKPFVVSTAMNSVTYAGLLFVTFLLNRNAALLQARVVPVAQTNGAYQGWAYYVPHHSSRIRRVRLDGTRDEASGFWLPQPEDDISIDTSDGVTADLVASSYGRGPSVLARLGKAGQAALLPFQVSPDGVVGLPGIRSSSSYEPGRTFQKPGNPRFKTLDYDTFHLVWPDMGMRFKSRTPKTGYHLALGSPFLSWNWRYATVLPDGRAVVAFGPQIVVVDIPTRRIAWLANGRSPAVLLDSPFR